MARVCCACLTVAIVHVHCCACSLLQRYVDCAYSRLYMCALALVLICVWVCTVMTRSADQRHTQRHTQHNPEPAHAYAQDYARNFTNQGLVEILLWDRSALGLADRRGVSYCITTHTRGDPSQKAHSQTSTDFDRVHRHRACRPQSR